VRPKGLHDGDLIATLKFRAAQAVLPNLERKFATFDLVKAHFPEEFRHISERKHGVQIVAEGFLLQCVDNRSPNSAGF
jgi:hypothetical protein